LEFWLFSGFLMGGFGGGNWIRFRTLLGMETGSNFVHF
jgi:hypothetical protein